MRFLDLLTGIVLLQAVLVNAEGGFKILALVPFYAKSHWDVFRPLLEELARRGNDVTVVSHHPRKTPLKNYHDISILDPQSSFVHTKDLDAIRSKSPWDEMHAVLKYGVEVICRKGLEHPNIQKLIKSEDKYDLLITEIFNTDCFLAFVHKFKAPFVAIRTSPLSPWSNDRIANPDNPSYIPNSLLGKQTPVGFRDRLENLMALCYYKFVYRSNDALSTEIARKHFGEDMPPVNEIAKNTSMILVNSHPIHQTARPLIPGVKEIGGIHIGKNKPLPKDLEDWMSGAEHGVVYFSLGSMLKPASMSESKRQSLFEAFSEIPQRVLMKWEDNDLEDLPRNVKTFKWAPQFDVLSHPKTKVFISHGGMLGTTEAVYAGTPMIVIPAFGDQLTNAALLQEKGFAVVLDYRSITKETVLAALRNVINDTSYREMAKRMSAVIRDRLVPPVEEAAYWVEYVARHKGAPFLRSPAHGMPLYQYLLLDVIGAIVVTISLVILVSWIIVKKIFALLIRQTGVSTKTAGREIRKMKEN